MREKEAYNYKKYTAQPLTKAVRVWKSVVIFVNRSCGGGDTPPGESHIVCLCGHFSVLCNVSTFQLGKIGPFTPSDTTAQHLTNCCIT